MIIKDLFEKQRRHANHFFDSLHLEPIEQLTQNLMNASGTLFFTGIGKSGLVAKKIALTMVSTGTKALYLPAAEAVHGDLGMMSTGDTCLILSKSGESDELLDLIPAIKNKGATAIAIVCNTHSRLAKACHSSIHLPLQEELCPFDMAPTNSVVSQILFGDLLTIALMKKKAFSLDEYALNHPSGRIGKRMTLKVEDIMLKSPAIPLCKPEDKLQDVLVELSDKRCGCLLICGEQLQLMGIFTDGDLRRALQKHGANILQTPMKELMHHNPQTTNPQTLAWSAMKQMEAQPQKRLMALPVVNHDNVVEGLLHLHDIIQRGLR